VPRRKLLEFYLLSKIVVVPSIYEGLPTVALEAMATGKPVVAADDGGPAEIVDHKSNGILVQPSDSDSYAEAIIHLLENRSTMQDMGEKAAVKAKAYSWQTMAKTHSESYDHIPQS